MAVKIRLARHGRKKRPFYHIIVADARSPRDGRFIEKIGYYNPMTSPATIELDRDVAYEWLTKGAQPTDTARAILKFKGVMYRKHLMRGVAKGSLTEEQAMEKYNKFINAKDEKVAKRFEQSELAKEEWHKKISGTAKAVVAAPVVEEVVETAAEAPAEAAAEAPVEAVAEAPAEAKEAAAEKVEEAKEAVAEKAEEAKEAVAEKVEEAKEAVAEKAEEVKEAAAEKVEEAKEAVAEKAEEAKEAVAEKVEEAKDAAAETPAEEKADDAEA